MTTEQEPRGGKERSAQRANRNKQEESEERQLNISAIKFWYLKQNISLPGPGPAAWSHKGPPVTFGSIFTLVMGTNSAVTWERQGRKKERVWLQPFSTATVVPIMTLTQDTLVAPIQRYEGTLKRIADTADRQHFHPQHLLYTFFSVFTVWVHLVPGEQEELAGKRTARAQVSRWRWDKVGQNEKHYSPQNELAG